MQKYRIYELAKIYNKGNDEIIAVLNKNNIEVKNRLNSKRDSRQSFCISFCQKE